MKWEWRFSLALWSVGALAALNLVWTLMWIGLGPLAVVALYGVTAYALAARRTVPTRFAAGVVGLAILLELVDTNRVGWDNLGRVDFWLLGANLALAPLFLVCVHRLNKAFPWAKRGVR